MKHPLLAAGLVACLMSPSMAFAQSARLDLGQRHQTIEGWGTSLFANSDSLNTYADQRFREAYRDLGLNIVRIPMEKEVLIHASGDYSVPVELGPDLQTNIDRMNFNAGPLSDWADFANWVEANALEPDRVRVTGSVWSPPHWMKGPTGATQDWVGNPSWYTDDDDMATPWLSGQNNFWRGGPGNPSNTGNSIGGRLRNEDPQVRQQYGRYMAAWVAGFEQAHDIDFHAISLQNESTFENPFDSMVVHVDQNGNTDFGQYAINLKAVKDAWQAYGLETKVMGPHVAQIGPNPQNPWSLNQQLGLINGVKNHSDPTLIDFLDYYNSNYYMPPGEDGAMATAGYYHGTDAVPTDWASSWGLSNWSQPGVGQDGKPIWFSETGGAEPQWVNGPGGTPGDGSITLVAKMFNALVHADASAYVYWQASDGSFSVSEHTLLSRNDLDNPLGSKKYAAFKHFSRFVRPGAQRVAAGFDGSASIASIGGNSEWDTLNSINLAAFTHEEDETLTLVALNTLGTDQTFTLDLGTDAFTDFDVYLTDETRSFEQITSLVTIGGILTIELPRYSVMTLHAMSRSIAIPGDANGDGRVNLSDFLILRRNFGSTSPEGFADGDFNGDGRVNLSDFLILRSNFGAGPDAGPLTSFYDAFVPEPATAGVVLMSGLALLRRRRA
jgi:O-glycosyl hydrolase